MIGLVDCNNFYASCERVFNPTLIGRPVVVLSNNDGCVIARSNEAKELGIPMGAPAFEIEALVEKNGVQVPEKIGLKGVTREGMDYELTIVFDININHQSRASKDRTGLFDKVPEFVITEKTGQRILQWCNHTITIEEMKQEISSCKTLEALTTLYHGYPEYQQSLSDEFTKKKLALNSVTSKASKNGATTSVS
jgi:hypothetical protein